MSSNDFKLTPQLKLLLFLLCHTRINNKKQPVTNKELVTIYLKENSYYTNLYLDVGLFLKILYGDDLKKYNTDNGVAYNLSTNKKPIKEVFIKDYENIYDFNQDMHRSKWIFENAKQCNLTLHKAFNNRELKKMDLKKIDNLSQDIIVYCLNKGIPGKYLKYFLFYLMKYTTPIELKFILQNEKRKFKKNKVCAVCGSNKNLTIHHIKPVNNYKYLEFNKNNFMVLCDKCHKEYHKSQALKLKK